jgi:hypothetical protein
MALSAKHEAVALAYFADPEKIGWRAYITVYPKSSQHAAETAFGRLLKNAEFAAFLADLGKQATQGKVMAAAEVLERISKSGRTEENPGVRLRALELMGKHHALFTERHVHELGGVAERLAAALLRVNERKAGSTDGDQSRPHRRTPRKRDARKAARKSKRARA